MWVNSEEVPFFLFDKVAARNQDHFSHWTVRNHPSYYPLKCLLWKRWWIYQRSYHISESCHSANKGWYFLRWLCAARDSAALLTIVEKRGGRVINLNTSNYPSSTLCLPKYVIENVFIHSIQIKYIKPCYCIYEDNSIPIQSKRDKSFSRLDQWRQVDVLHPDSIQPQETFLTSIKAGIRQKRLYNKLEFTIKFWKY